jgi:hypothetical protein
MIMRFEARMAGATPIMKGQPYGGVVWGQE